MQQIFREQTQTGAQEPHWHWDLVFYMKEKKNINIWLLTLTKYLTVETYYSKSLLNEIWKKCMEKCTSHRLVTEVKNTIQLHLTEMITKTSSLELSSTLDNNVPERWFNGTKRPFVHLKHGTIIDLSERQKSNYRVRRRKRKLTFLRRLPSKTRKMTRSLNFRHCDWHRKYLWQV